MLAVLFVVEDPSKGYRLAFRYPPSETPTGSNDKVSTVLDQHTSHQLTLTESMATLNELCKDSGGKTVARLLRPKERSMCDCPFRLSVNNLLFVGHPTTVPSSVLQTPTHLSDPSSTTDHTTVQNKISFFNVVFAMEWLRSDIGESASETENHGHGGSASSPPSLEVVSEVAERLSYALLCEENRCAFLSQVIKAHSRASQLKKSQPHSQAIAERHHSGGSISDEGEETSILDGVCGGDYVSEEGYGGGEVAALLKDVFTSLIAKHSLALTVNGWLDLSVRLRPMMDPAKMTPLVSNGSLAQEVFFNGSTYASLDGNFNPLQTRKGNMQLSDVEVLTIFRPYQTMLLLQDEEQVIKALPPDSSHQLLALVRAANPLLSFRELSVTTGVPLRQVHKLSAHLSFWGQATVIDTIVMENQYRLIPRPTPTKASLEFHQQFRGVQSLYRVLSFFKPNLTLTEIMRQHVPPRSHLVFLHMVIWLLQHGLLQQVHPYVYLFRPLKASHPMMKRRGNRGAADQTSFSATEDESNEEEDSRGEGGEDKEEEEGDSTASLFRCIVFHLLNASETSRRTGDGNEACGVRMLELLWREHITRQQFETVLSTYSSHLYICWHQ